MAFLVSVTSSRLPDKWDKKLFRVVPQGKTTITKGAIERVLTGEITTHTHPGGSVGSGDMEAATYDPTSVEGDAFDMDNMAEGTTNKILTAAERSLIASALQSETSHADVVVEDYETVSKNLKSYPYAIAYGVDGISTMTYDLGGGDSIVKTFNYTTGVLTSIVLSGDVPGGIPLTKTLGYTGSDLTSIIYS